jgi:hypothetical protein
MMRNTLQVSEGKLLIMAQEQNMNTDLAELSAVAPLIIMQSLPD